MQKVHLWMDCGKRILWSWTQSKATKIRAATVQSSVWTLQQILSDSHVPIENRLYLRIGLLFSYSKFTLSNQVLVLDKTKRMTYTMYKSSGE